jgi:hypothetical protein
MYELSAAGTLSDEREKSNSTSPLPSKVMSTAMRIGGVPGP